MSWEWLSENVGNAWDWLNENVDTGDLVGLGGAGIAGLLGGFGSSQTPTGYQGSIPKLTYNREALPMENDPNRRPGSGGRRYFTDGQYVPTPQANSSAAEQSAIAAITGNEQPQQFAKGGIAELSNGRYLRGNSDGMADKVKTSIEGKAPAELSHGEFVIPADVVSHLGNGNSEAGARKLEQMMARIRQSRTGSPEQGKQINPDEFLPV